MIGTYDLIESLMHSILRTQETREIMSTSNGNAFDTS